MAIYLGFYSPVPEFARAQQERARAGDRTIDPQFAYLIIELPRLLPPGCRLLGSYAPEGWLSQGGPEGALPGVLVVDTDTPADLTFLSQYYLGFLTIRWTPATTPGTTRPEREAALEAAALQANTLMEALGVV